MMNLKALFQLIRPKHWIKNLLVFAALIFSEQLFDQISFVRVCIVFFAFCAISSACYILNDFLDLKEDQQHPSKRFRPLATGTVSKRTARILSGLLLMGSFLMGLGLGKGALFVLLGYGFIQLIYSFGLKRVVILDVMLLAMGFVLRAVAGGVVIYVNISNWLLLCTFLLALFLALCKRRQEMVILKHVASQHRHVLSEYSITFIDSLISVITGATVVTYAFYTVSRDVQMRFGTDRLIFTVPFVIYGIFRYLYLIHQKEMGDNPTQVLYCDFALQLDIFLWLVICLTLIYI